MSDQGVMTDLEELFLAREFGRVSGRHLRVVEEDLGEAPEPRELEDVFLSRDFGRPVALELLEGGAEAVPNVVVFPFAGPGAKSWDRPVRQRAVAAVSGVAAAALVLTGLASGNGQPPQSSVSALGHIRAEQPQGGTAGSLGSPAGAGAQAPAGLTGSSSGGASGPSIVLATQHGGASLVQVSGGGSSIGVGPGPGSAPPPAPPGSTGLAPVSTIVGAAGSTVSAAAGNVATMLPGTPTISATTAMSQAGNNLSVLGQSISAPIG